MCSCGSCSECREEARKTKEFVHGVIGTEVGFWGGMATGAAVGTAVPVIGTAAGAIVGAILGAYSGSKDKTTKDNVRSALGAAGGIFGSSGS